MSVWNRVIRACALGVLVITSLAVGHSCTDAGLQPITEPIAYVDDKLSITGQFLSSPADEVVFPVKILLAMDQSASLQCTDPGNNRLTAVNQACAPLDALPNVEFGVVGFASWSAITEFTPDWPTASDALAPEGGQGGPATDYQGALSTVLTVLEQDMLEEGPAVVARTKYMVVFISDGVPEPRCRAGCDDGDTPPDSLYGVCNTTEEIPDDVYVDMHSLCPEYNQPPQIVQKVQDIVSLGEFYGAGDITLSTVLIFASPEEVAAQCGDVTQFGYVKEEAEPLLQAMADEGGGTYRDVQISQELDFLDFDYESLEAPYELTELFAININAIPTEAGIAVDTDRDGIDDQTEFDLGLNRHAADSDGDLFGDLLELRFASKGFDPLDETIPAIGCSGTDDRDGDGLRECEETFLETDPLLTDTDGDRIPDGIEVRLGTDPTVHDTLVDHDFDGRLSGTEVRTGTHPQLFDEEDAMLAHLHYSVDVGPAMQDQTRLYDYVVQNVTLVPTLSTPEADTSKGLNRVLIFSSEHPVSLAGSRGRFHVACIEARYLGETYKDPPSGQVQGVSPLRFIEIQDFDAATHCLHLGEDPGAIPEGIEL
jgi:hypothetical protein